MKLKGTLEIERKTIRCLLIVGVVALCVSAFLEYGQGNIIPQDWCDLLHTAFLTNVALGISGSAIISMFCLLLPYITKKRILTNQITLLVKQVYCDYEKVHFIMVSNSQKDKVDRSYSGEVELAKALQHLSQSIERLTGEYAKMEFATDKINLIVTVLNEQISSVIYLAKNFLQIMVPEEYITNLTEVPITQKKKHFIVGEDQALYLLLINAAEQIIPHDEVQKLFEEYSSGLEAASKILKDGLTDLQDSIYQHNLMQKMFGVKLQLNLAIMETKEKFLGIWCSQQDEISKRTSEIRRAYAQEAQAKYNKNVFELTAEIDNTFNEEGYDSANQKLQELERELKNLHESGQDDNSPN